MVDLQSFAQMVANRGGKSDPEHLANSSLPSDTAGMAKKSEPPKPIYWKVYKIANKLVWLGDVEAPDEAAAMERAAAEFKVAASRLMALRRS